MGEESRAEGQLPEPGAYAYTDGASSGSRGGPGGYGVILTWNGETREISGGKGTINFVLQQLIGEDNSVSPSLSSFGNQSFDLEATIAKKF